MYGAISPLSLSLSHKQTLNAFSPTDLRLRSNDKTYTIQRARGSNTKSGSLPNFFYRGTSYGIALFDESETNLHDLRDEIDKLNPTMVESVYFHSKESENDDEIVHEGYIVVFAHEPGAQHHDERDEWNVMWLARRSGQHYVFKWWAHVWGPPHKSDTYDHENLETFRHSHVMEALVPSNPKWSELAFHEEPVVGILDRNDEEL